VAVAGEDGAGAEPLTKQDFEALARFRFGIRRYLRFSEETVRGHGLAPQQYVLLLALKGFPDREWATVRELADRLQLRHHSVVELVNRAQGQGLVERAAHPDDARAVRVLLTEDGEAILARLSALHRDELRRRMTLALRLPTWHDDAAGAEPPFTARPGQVDYTHVRYAPVLNAVVVCGGRVLLLQRSSGMRSYPDCWCGVSGYLDHDRSVEEMARREMWEEVGIADDRILTMERGTVLLQEAPEHGKSWLVVPVLVRVRGEEYRLDWESQAAGWFTFAGAAALDLLPGFDAVLAQYRELLG
jgi:DNA-binding MarR family transcriptional regulator/8-oxo-dGTP pyrophosphatase MutT (NUDIX family)